MSRNPFLGVEEDEPKEPPNPFLDEPLGLVPPPPIIQIEPPKRGPGRPRKVQ